MNIKIILLIGIVVIMSSLLVGCDITNGSSDKNDTNVYRVCDVQDDPMSFIGVITIIGRVEYLTRTYPLGFSLVDIDTPSQFRIIVICAGETRPNALEKGM